MALMQMAKTSAAAARLAESGVPYVSVLTDPTTGGVLASYAILGDIILAEPQALIGFAGARVVAQASVQKPPEGYQTAEWQLGRGQIDQVVTRREMPTTIASILTLLGYGPGGPKLVPFPDAARREDGSSVDQKTFAGSRANRLGSDSRDEAGADVRPIEVSVG